jgi:hypothetical protein
VSQVQDGFPGPSGITYKLFNNSLYTVDSWYEWFCTCLLVQDDLVLLVLWGHLQIILAISCSIMKLSTLQLVLIMMLQCLGGSGLASFESGTEWHISICGCHEDKGFLCCDCLGQVSTLENSLLIGALIQVRVVQI